LGRVTGKVGSKVVGAILDRLTCIKFVHWYIGRIIMRYIV
jgi:hypothetical protein